MNRFEAGIMEPTEKLFWVSATVLAFLTLNIHLLGAAAESSAVAPRNPAKSGSSEAAFCKEVLILHHSHVDVGYTHPQSMYWELQKGYLNAALDMLDRTDAWPDDISRPRWTAEATAPVMRWLQTASEPEVRRLKKHVKSGRFGISGFEYNTTPLASAEGLARQLYHCRVLREKLGADIRTVNQHDVTGIPWTAVDLLLDSNIELLIMAINLHLSGTPMPRPAEAVRVSVASAIDGDIKPTEWPGKFQTLDREPSRCTVGGAPVLAKFAYDDICLYVAANVTMFGPAKVTTNSIWGKDDGVEICLAGNTPDGKPATFVVRGYPCGAVQSATDAGAPADAVERLGKAARFAAQATPGPGGGLFGKGWRGEWAIPFSALGLTPTPGLTVAFNMSAFCSEFGEWHCWEGTQAERWRLDQAGTLSLKKSESDAASAR